MNFSQGVKFDGVYTIEVKDKDGNLKDREVVENLIVNTGLAEIAGLIGNTGSPTAFTYLAVGSADLVNGQRDYELPSTAQKNDRVEVLDNLGNSQKLEAIDKSQISISMDEFEKTAGIPKYYDVLGRSLLLYPAPSSSNTTLSNGIKLYFSRDINEFQTTDTSASPGFIEDFHEMISVGAAIDFAETVGDYNRSTTLNNRMKSFKEDLVKYYGSNQRDLMPNIAPNYKRHK